MLSASEWNAQRKGGEQRRRTIAFGLVIAQEGRHDGADGRGVARQRIGVDLDGPKRAVVCSLRGEGRLFSRVAQRVGSGAGKTRFVALPKRMGWRRVSVQARPSARACRIAVDITTEGKPP